MKSYTKTLLAVTSVILFNACGGGGSSDISNGGITSYTTEELLAFNVINLDHNVDPLLCDQSQWEQNNAGEYFQDLTVGQVNSDITCIDFESVDTDITCLEIDHTDLYQQAGQPVPSNAITCVIAYNRGE